MSVRQHQHTCDSTTAWEPGAQATPCDFRFQYSCTPRVLWDRLRLQPLSQRDEEAGVHSRGALPPTCTGVRAVVPKCGERKHPSQPGCLFSQLAARTACPSGFKRQVDTPKDGEEFAVIPELAAAKITREPSQTLRIYVHELPPWMNLAYWGEQLIDGMPESLSTAGGNYRRGERERERSYPRGFWRRQQPSAPAPCLC